MRRVEAGRSDDSFTQFVLDQLNGLGVVEARKMFGGRGLYWKAQIFGLIDEGRLYFRVSDATVGHYQALGAKPFEPWPGHVMNGYYEVPAEILEDADEAVAWAREAWALPRKKPRSRSARTTPATRTRRPAKPRAR
jgi:DNA transformation protein and related proteins